MDPPTERWPVFPPFDQQTLATIAQNELADRGDHQDAIDEQRQEYVRELLLALDEDVRHTMDGAQSILQRLSETAEIIGKE